MPDAIIKDLWEIKDAIAREHGYDLDALIAHLESRRQAEGRPTVDLSARKKASAQMRMDSRRNSEPGE